MTCITDHSVSISRERVWTVEDWRRYAHAAGIRQTSLTVIMERYMLNTGVKEAYCYDPERRALTHVKIKENSNV